MLKPSGRPLAAWIGCKPIEITWLPFVSNYQFDLVLNDNNPYQLSREPFVIYTYDGKLMIRDSGRYHGDREQPAHRHRPHNQHGPLRLGKNSSIVGSTDSSYCFTLLIEAS